MFILLKSGAMLNLYWLLDCFQGKVDKNIVIFYMVNGTKITEEYESETEASLRVDEVHKSMSEALPGFSLEIVDKLPTENISTKKLYLVPSGEDADDMYREYRYINGKWELMGIQKLDLKPIENRLNIVEGKVSSLETEMTNVKGRVTTLETDVTEVQGKVSTLETDMVEVKGDIATLETDMTEVKGDVSTLKTDMTDVKDNISSLETELAGVEDNVTTVETDVATLKTDMTSVEERITAIEENLKWNEY